MSFESAKHSFYTRKNHFKTYDQVLCVHEKIQVYALIHGVQFLYIHILHQLKFFARPLDAQNVKYICQ